MTRAAEWLLAVVEKKFGGDRDLAKNLIHYTSRVFKESMTPKQSSIDKEETFRKQHAVIKAIESTIHDTEICQSARALAGLSYGKWDHARKHLFYKKVLEVGHEPEQDVWKWISKPLSNGNSERPPGDQISDGICMPHWWCWWCQRTGRC